MLSHSLIDHVIRELFIDISASYLLSQRPVPAAAQPPELPGRQPAPSGEQTRPDASKEAGRAMERAP